jgi:hypothetical protein
MDSGPVPWVPERGKLLPGTRLEALEEPRFLRAVRNKKVLGLLVVQRSYAA